MDVLYLALQKICNFKKKDHFTYFACISYSFALEACSQIVEIEMLIVSHMSTVIDVSNNCMDTLCTYSSDPILTSGTLLGIIEFDLEKCLDILLEQFSHGVIEAGENGELISCILFLEAYIHSVETMQPSQVTYLKKVPYF